MDYASSVTHVVCFKMYVLLKLLNYNHYESYWCKYVEIIFLCNGTVVSGADGST